MPRILMWDWRYIAKGKRCKNNKFKKKNCKDIFVKSTQTDMEILVLAVLSSFILHFVLSPFCPFYMYIYFYF